MARDLKDVFEQATEKLRKAGRDVGEAIADEERIDDARRAARDAEQSFGNMLDDLSEEATRVLQSEEVERAVDRMGSALKDLAQRIRESRESEPEDVIELDPRRS